MKSDAARPLDELKERPSLDPSKLQAMQPHSKVPFAERLHWCLELVSNMPGLIPNVGIVDTSEGLFIHSNVLAAFMRIKSNSLNKNLRDHGFCRKSSSNEAHQIRQLIPSLVSEGQYWSKWIHVSIPFNRSTPPENLKRISELAAMNRQGSHPHIPGRVVLPSIDEVLAGAGVSAQEKY
jgi:hypothetical protein